MTTSSCSDPKFLRSAFVPQAKVMWKGKEVSIPDTLDYNYQNTLSQLVPIYTASIIDGAPLTSISYDLYSNTSAFWTIPAANGYFQWLSLYSGTPVGYPDTSFLLSGPANSSSNNTSTTSSNPTVL